MQYQTRKLELRWTFMGCVCVSLAYGFGARTHKKISHRFLIVYVIVVLPLYAVSVHIGWCCRCYLSLIECVTTHWRRNVQTLRRTFRSILGNTCVCEPQTLIRKGRRVVIIVVVAAVVLPVASCH